MRFGVNYTPSKNWLFFLQDYDADSVNEDLKGIADLGMDHLRLCLVWSLAQPSIGYVSEHYLDNLERFMRAAGKHGIEVCPSVLTGWCCGYTYLPAFRLKRNLFTDPDMIIAEKSFLKAVVERTAKYDNLLGIDLGNELNVVGNPAITQQAGSEVTLEEGDRWLRDMVEYVDRLLPGRCMSVGVDHQPWFHDSVFSRSLLANASNPVPVHAYAEFIGAVELFGRTAEEAVRTIEYCIELAKAYVDYPAGKSIWVQETGACGMWFSSVSEQIEFMIGSLRNAVACEDLWGVTFWASHQIRDEFSEFSPEEKDMGLIGRDGRPRPLAVAIRNFIREIRHNPIEAIHKNTALLIDDSPYAELLAEQPYIWPKTPGLTLMKRYMEHSRNGFRPAIVRKSRAGDAAYLKARGIEKLISC